jgi:hypothetical protein
VTDDVTDEPEDTYRVWFAPGPEWFERQREILRPAGQDPPGPGEYPRVVRSGITQAEAEDYVQLDGHPEHPEWHWIEPD